MRVEVVPYDERWPSYFEVVRRELADLLTGVPVHSIEHVGSTSVPGLAAKPIIDIDIIVDIEVVELAVSALSAGAYTYKGDLGIYGRHAFGSPADPPSRNVYVTVAGCLALRNHLAVRDVLRSDASLRHEYGQLKLALAMREVASIEEYVAAKSEVLRRVLARGGLNPGDLDDIEAVNRQ